MPRVGASILGTAAAVCVNSEGHGLWQERLASTVVSYGASQVGLWAARNTVKAVENLQDEFVSRQNTKVS